MGEVVRHVRIKAAVVALILTLGSLGVAEASDIPSDIALDGLITASKHCPSVCAKHDCAWSGEWKPASEQAKGACDCGPERNRSVPGGSFRDQAGADAACPQICDLQGDKYKGGWDLVYGGYSVCKCIYVADWCEPKKP